MLKNAPGTYGLYAGLATVVLMVVAYLLDRRLMLSPAVVWGSLLFYIYFMVRAVRDAAASWEGEERLPFRAALQPGFQVYVVATVLYYLFYYLMFNVVDPDLATLQQDLMIEQLDQVEGLFGAERVAEMQRAIEQDGLRFTLPRLLIAFGQSLIGGFLIALIVAGVARPR